MILSPLFRLSYLMDICRIWMSMSIYLSFQGISLRGLRGFSVAEVFVSSSPSQFMFSLSIWREYVKSSNSYCCGLLLRFLFEVEVVHIMTIYSPPLDSHRSKLCSQSPHFFRIGENPSFVFIFKCFCLIQFELAGDMQLKTLTKVLLVITIIRLY